MLTPDSNLSCKQAEPYYYAFSCTEGSEFIPASIINHIEQCQDCRAKMGRLKVVLSQAEATEPEHSHASSAITRLLRLHFAYIGEHVTCNTVRTFLPALLHPALQIRIPSPITVHLDNCQQCSEDLETIRGLRLNRKQLCRLSQLLAQEPPRNSAQCSQMSLAKMQELRNTVHELSERAESDVVTVFHIDESAKVPAAGESDDPYAGFPIRVEIRSRQDEADPKQSVSTTDVSTALKQKASAMNLRLLVKAAGVAAVILVAVALLLNAPAAKAITIRQIYEALEKATNVHISSFVPGKAEPTQEKWISHSFEICLTKTGRKLVLWDMRNRTKRIKDLDTGVTHTSGFANDMSAGIGRTLTAFFGVVPFEDLSVVPTDAELSPVTDDDFERTTDDIEVYDLAWVAQKAYDASGGFRRWRVFVDPVTNRPQRTEFYSKLATDTEYTLTSVKVLQYLSDLEMQAVIRDASF